MHYLLVVVLYLRLAKSKCKYFLSYNIRNWCPQQLGNTETITRNHYLYTSTEIHSFDVLIVAVVIANIFYIEFFKNCLSFQIVIESLTGDSITFIASSILLMTDQV